MQRVLKITLVLAKQGPQREIKAWRAQLGPQWYQHKGFLLLPKPVLAAPSIGR